MNLKDNFLLQVIEITQINPLQKKRQRLIVEVRALLINLLNNVLGMGCSYIRDYFISKGYKTHHATIIHAIKNWEIYTKYNPQLLNWYHDILLSSDMATDEVKKEYIKDKLQYLSSQQLEEMFKIVEENFEDHIKKLQCEQETKLIGHQEINNS